MTVQLILELAAEHVPATLLRQQLLARVVEERLPDIDLPAGTAAFDTDMVFPMQVVGTVNDAERTFTWAWATPEAANPGVLTAVTALRAYGQEHAIDELTEAVWHADDVDPFLLAAIARGWAQADAMYRAPLPGGAVYLLLGDVPLPTPTAHQVVQALTTGIALAPMDHRVAAMSLFGDNGLSVTGMDQMLVATVGSSFINVSFTAQGRIEGVDVSHL